MSIESINNDEFRATSLTREPGRVFVEQVPNHHYDATDRAIDDESEAAQSVIDDGNVAIDVNIAQAVIDTNRETNLAAGKAEIARIEARVEQDRLIDEAKLECKQKVAEIGRNEVDTLHEIVLDGVDTKIRLQACRRVFVTLEEGIARYKNEHGIITESIADAMSSLDDTQAEKDRIAQRIAQKTAAQAELRRKYNATEGIIERNREQSEELMSLSTDISEEKYLEGRKIAEADLPLTDEAINSAFSEMEQQDFAYSLAHRDTMNRLDSIQKEIHEANIRNKDRKNETIRLGHDIEFLTADTNGLSNYMTELDAYLQGLMAMKQEIAKTMTLLRIRSEAVQEIARNGLESIENVPLELLELVKAAIGREKTGNVMVDRTTTLPEYDRTVVNMVISPETVAFASIIGLANRPTTTKAPVAEVAEAKTSSLVEKFKDRSVELNALRAWVQENAGGLLPAADQLIPQGIMKQGLHAHLRSAEK